MRIVATLSRGLIAVVGLGFAIAAAIGSGVSDVLALVGLQLTPAQNVLVGTVVFGVAVLWDNASLRRQLSGHAGAPYLAWTGPSARMDADGTVTLEIWCENDGPRDSVAVTMTPYVESSRKEDLLTATLAPWSRIMSRKNGDQHRFKFVVKGTPPADGPWFGKREITWGIFYFDSTDTKRVYVTQASVRVDFQTAGAYAVISDNEQWLDATSSPEDRHRRWRSHKHPPTPFGSSSST
jgi:hypothetical protein